MNGCAYSRLRIQSPSVECAYSIRTSHHTTVCVAECVAAVCVAVFFAVCVIVHAVFPKVTTLLCVLQSVLLQCVVAVCVAVWVAVHTVFAQVTTLLCVMQSVLLGCSVLLQYVLQCLLQCIQYSHNSPHYSMN